MISSQDTWTFMVLLDSLQKMVTSTSPSRTSPIFHWPLWLWLSAVHVLHCVCSSSYKGCCAPPKKVVVHNTQDPLLLSSVEVMRDRTRSRASDRKTEKTRALPRSWRRSLCLDPIVGQTGYDVPSLTCPTLTGVASGSVSVSEGGQRMAWRWGAFVRESCKEREKLKDRKKIPREKERERERERERESRHLQFGTHIFGGDLWADTSFFLARDVTSPSKEDQKLVWTGGHE